MYLQQAKIRKGSMGLASHSLMREIVAPNTEMVNDGTSLILLALPVVLFVCVCACSMVAFSVMHQGFMDSFLIAFRGPLMACAGLYDICSGKHPR